MKGKRMLAWALSLVLLAGMFPAAAFAAGKGPPCENHPKHEDACGYAEARPCGHREHTAACYTDELICGFDGEAEQTATVIGADVSHAHTRECYALDCPHSRGVHDDTCCYAEGRSCSHECNLCAPKDNDSTPKPPGQNVPNGSYRIAAQPGPSSGSSKISGLTATGFSVKVRREQAGSILEVSLDNISLDKDDAGTVSYSYSSHTANSLISGKPMVDEKKLRIPITASPTSGSTDSVTVTVSTENYSDVQATIELTFSSPPLIKPIPNGPVTVGDLVYGQTLGDLALINPGFTDGQTPPTEIKGTLGWTNPYELFSVGIHNAEWKFVPDDKTTYDTANGTVSVKVKRAVPVVKFPSFGSQTFPYGTKLSEIRLNGGFDTGGGDFEWESPNTVPEIGTKSYTVVLNPVDMMNYDYSSIVLEQEVVVEVRRIQLNIALSNVTKTYDGLPASVTANVTDENGQPIQPAVDIQYFDSNGTPLKAAPSDAGSYWVSASVDEHGIYAKAFIKESLTIHPAEGTLNPEYQSDKQTLDSNMPHALTNAQNTLNDVPLPKNWSWQVPNTTLTATDANGGRQTFQARYESQNPNYKDVDSADVTILVTKILFERLTTQTISIGASSSFTISYTVTGAPLSGSFQFSWDFQNTGILDIKTVSKDHIEITGLKNGLALVDIKAFGLTVSNVLIQVSPKASGAISNNTADDIRIIVNSINEALKDSSVNSFIKNTALSYIASEVSKLSGEEQWKLEETTLEKLDNMIVQAKGLNQLSLEGIDSINSGTLPLSAHGWITATANAAGKTADTSVTLRVTRRTPITAPQADAELLMEFQADGIAAQPGAPIRMRVTLPNSAPDISPSTHALNNYAPDGTLINGNVLFTVNGREVTFIPPSSGVYSFKQKAAPPDSPNRPEKRSVNDSPTPVYLFRFLSDQTSGVKVEGGQILESGGLTVRAWELHNAGDAGCDLLREAQKTGRILCLYDVSLSHTFRGKVTVSLPVEGRDGQILTVAHCVGGRLLLSNTTVKQGFAEVAAETLSPFAVLDGIYTPETLASPAAGCPFIDVKENDPFYKAVLYAYQNGLMNGTAANLFTPRGAMTRSQVSAALYRLEGSPAVTSQNPFTDVQPGQWYAPSSIWAAETGLVEGQSAAVYGPGDPITREQLALILWRYAKYRGWDVDKYGNADISGYTDAADISEGALPALRWACGAGIIEASPDNLLTPKAWATRAESAQMFLKLQEKYQQPKALPAALPEVGSTRRHQVRAGDTLSGLASKYNTTAAAIMRANPIIKNPNFIRPGQVLYIP